MTKKVSSDPERIYSPVSFQQIVLTCRESRIWIMSDWHIMLFTKPRMCDILMATEVKESQKMQARLASQLKSTEAGS